eukprot:360919-Chlamydomonas_euryale.AAC.1
MLCASGGGGGLGQRQGSRSLPSAGALRGSVPSATEALLGPDVAAALVRPSTAYHSPVVGLASPAGTSVAKLKPPTASTAAVIRTLQRASRAEADAIAEGVAPPSDEALMRLLAAGGAVRPLIIGDHVPRPTAVLDNTVPDLLVLKELQDQQRHAAIGASIASDAEARGADGAASISEATVGEIGQAIRLVRRELAAPAPLGVALGTGDGGPDKTYQFPNYLAVHPRHLCLFEHVEGCRFCEQLYGHYLLPNGKLAHFYAGDTVRKGHRVDVMPPPDVPYTSSDWLGDGVPTCALLAPPDAHLARGAEMASPLWCPVPELGPLVARDHHILEWEDDKVGVALRAKTLALYGRVEYVTRTETTVEEVAPKPAKKKKRK